MPIHSKMVRRRPTSEARRNGTVYSLPQLKIAPARIIRENEHKCLVCLGIPNIVRLNGTAKVTGFQPMNKPYRHKKGCKNENKF